MAETAEQFDTRLARVESELAGLKRLLAGGQAFPPVELYSDERIAEFLLSSAVDAESYRTACEEVRRMGFDPVQVAHWVPEGGWSAKD